MRFKLFPVILTAALTSVMTLFAVSHFQNRVPYLVAANSARPLPVNYAAYNNGNTPPSSGPVNFEQAAASSVKAVVHIKTEIDGHRIIVNNNDMFSQLFGPQEYMIPQQNGSGSGVVISPDGYIVTNNHVVADANEVIVTFNDKYNTKAKVIGTDPATDIAVLKIETDKQLPYMEFANSDDVKLGQWVLAVGFPLNLDATVTAGIVSAKGRSLGINKKQSANPVESYIQTDAAVNPGNSGGALVNTAGQLIGINSAIASPTGSYAGYSYAVPANIVRKAVNDLMKYGAVQRAVMGVEYLDSRLATPEQLAATGLDKADGVYVVAVLPNSAALKSGIRKGDFITHINGEAVNTQSDVQEQIARYQPGDNVSVTYSRDGKVNTANVQLTNVNGTTEIIKNDSQTKVLGATFRPLTQQEKITYNTGNGVVVTDPGRGSLERQTQMVKGFVVISINNTLINSVNDMLQALAAGKEAQIAGFYPGRQGMHYFTLNNVDIHQE